MSEFDAGPWTTYKRRLANVNDLQARLTQSTNAAASNPDDWGYASDLGYVCDRLNEALTHISGPETASLDDLAVTPPPAHTIWGEGQTDPGNDYTGHPMAEGLTELTASIKSLIERGHSYLTDSDYELAGSTFTDVADLHAVRDHVWHNEYKRAARVIDTLDTAVRDEIPTSIYDKITDMH